jgi:hypothetical protein
MTMHRLSSVISQPSSASWSFSVLGSWVVRAKKMVVSSSLHRGIKPLAG